MIDPDERTATVYRGRGDAHVYGVGDILEPGEAVPGFSVSVAELFG